VRRAVSLAVSGSDSTNSERPYLLSLMSNSVVRLRASAFSLQRARSFSCSLSLTTSF